MGWMGGWPDVESPGRRSLLGGDTTETSPHPTKREMEDVRGGETKTEHPWRQSDETRYRRRGEPETEDTERQGKGLRSGGKTPLPIPLGRFG